MTKQDCKAEWEYPSSATFWVCQRPKGHKGLHQDYGEVNRVKWLVMWSRKGAKSPIMEKKPE